MHGLDVSIVVDKMSYSSHAPESVLIEGLACDIPAGSWTAFLGRSGAGKTTLLRILAGLERQYEGRVSIGPEVVAGKSVV